jgi:DNA-binding transcriptional regulator GbsR (MarR family)
MDTVPRGWIAIAARTGVRIPYTQSASSTAFLQSFSLVRRLLEELAMTNPAARQRDLESGIYEMTRHSNPAEAGLRSIEDGFIEAWARMAGAFAMDRTMGRIHALVYVSSEELGMPQISERLGIPADVAEIHLTTLVEWGLVYRSGSVFAAEQDPWAWFLRTIRARQRNELLPIRNGIEAVRDAARQLAQNSKGPAASKLRVTLNRIERFTSFVGDFAKLVDALVTLGAAPMLKFVSMATRFVPRRAA